MKIFYYDKLNIETKNFLKILYERKKNFLYSLTEDEKMNICELLLMYELSPPDANEQIIDALCLLSKKEAAPIFPRPYCTPLNSLSDFREMLFESNKKDFDSQRRRYYILDNFFRELLYCLREEMTWLVNVLIENCLEELEEDINNNKSDDPDTQYEFYRDVI